MLRAAGGRLAQVFMLIAATLIVIGFSAGFSSGTAEAKKRDVKVSQQDAKKSAKAKRTKKVRVARNKRNRPAVVRPVDDGYRSPRYASIVVDVNSGKVLNQTDPDGLRHPASVTKVMTLYLLFEQLEAGKLTLDSELAVSERASAQAPSKLGLKPGSTLRVEDAIRALITRSANDAAVVVAEAIGGSESRFAQMMTRKARQLGMTRTVYRNASGLPNPDQVTTARDLAKLGVAIQDRFPRYYRYFSTRSFVYRGQPIANHNKLLGKVEGVDGIKTGYTRASGFNLLTSVKHDGRQLIAVVLGGTSGASRDATMRKLITASLPRAYAGARQTRMFAEAPAPAIEPDVNVAAVEAPAKPPKAAEPKAPAEASNDIVIADLPKARPAVVAETARPVANEPAAEATIVAAAEPVVMPAPRPFEIGRPAVASTDAMGPALRWVTGPAPLTEPASEPARTAEAVTDSPEMTASVPVRTLTFKVDTETGTIAEDRPETVAVLEAQPEAAPAAEPVAEKAVAAAAPTPTVSRDGWIIQIGATDSEGAARKLLDRARSTGHRALADAEPFTESVEKNGSTLWRARFAGFDDQKQARAACAALKSKSFSCLAVRL
ncbi:MAG: SPOR domain-containing protein [Labrys sp. (in: a-proteobacteria)]|jgi:D-alanyl-D-alanine carboxypeptidase